MSPGLLRADNLQVRFGRSPSISPPWRCNDSKGQAMHLPMRLKRTLLATAAVCGATLGSPAPVAAEPVIGLVDRNGLTMFDSSSPGTATATVSVTRLQPGESSWASTCVRARAFCTAWATLGL